MAEPFIPTFRGFSYLAPYVQMRNFIGRLSTLSANRRALQISPFILFPSRSSSPEGQQVFKSQK